MLHYLAVVKKRAPGSAKARVDIPLSHNVGCAAVIVGTIYRLTANESVFTVIRD